MRRVVVLLLVATTTSIMATEGASAQMVVAATTPVTEATPHPAVTPVVISQHVRRPARVRTFVGKWKPWGYGLGSSPGDKAKVQAIVRHEHRLWGGPSVWNRIACESGFNGSVVNPLGYTGAAQFGPIWGSMWPGTPRRVKLVRRDRKRMSIIRVTRLSDGTIKRETLGRFTGVRRYVRIGTIPKNATPKHAWANVRVAQRAASGVGPTTGWECPL